MTTRTAAAWNDEDHHAHNTPHESDTPPRVDVQPVDGAADYIVLKHVAEEETRKAEVEEALQESRGTQHCLRWMMKENQNVSVRHNSN